MFGHRQVDTVDRPRLGWWYRDNIRLQGLSVLLIFIEVRDSAIQKTIQLVLYATM